MVELEDNKIRYWQSEVDRLKQEIQEHRFRFDELCSLYIDNYNQLRLFDTHWTTMSKLEEEVFHEKCFLKRVIINSECEIKYLQEDINEISSKLRKQWESEGVIRWLM